MRGRKKTLLEPTQVYTLQVPVTAMERLKLLSQTKGVTVPEVIRGAIAGVLEGTVETLNADVEVSSFRAGYLRGLRDAARRVRSIREAQLRYPDGKSIADIVSEALSDMAGGPQ